MPDGSLGHSEYNCDKCYQLKFDDNIPPTCETGVCPIQNLAVDPVLTRMLKEFTHRRMLFELTNSDIVYNKLCEDFGFFDDHSFHYQCEAIYLQWRHKAKQKSKSG